MKIVIFGTGKAAENALNEIDNSCVEIIAITDNNENRWFQMWNGYKVIPPHQLNTLEFEYVLIASMYTEDIMFSLLNKGIEFKKIVPLFDNINEKLIKENYKKIYQKLFKQNKTDKIALITRRNSGCNALALYKNVPEQLQGKVELIGLEEIRKNKKDYHLSVTTSLEARHSATPINIETWHGFPLKSIGVLEKNLVDNISNTNEGITYITSYSNFYSFIMSSIYKIDIEKFIVTGMPRNDLLVTKDAYSNLSKIINRPLNDKKIVFYLPTFRKRKGKNVWEGESINRKNEGFKKLDDFLLLQNTYLIIKKHPAESDEFEHKDYKNIFFIDDLDLKELDIDFYEILGASNLLITDYSSVYFDYLLLDKPVLFWIPDKEQYADNRGFLFENIEALMPGPIVMNTDELIDKIELLLKDPQLYSQERDYVKKLVHKHLDFNSTNRLWSFITNEIE